MLSIKDKLQNKLKKSPEPKYDRLPINIPISYYFPVSVKKKKEPEFKNSNSIDISSNGLSIQIVDLDEDTNKKLSTPKHKILVKVEVPEKKKTNLIELSGSVKWVKTEKIKSKFQIITGIEFDEADFDKRLVLLSYALSLHRKKKIIRISTIILSVLLLFTSIWGIRTFVVKQDVEKKLVISEVSRTNLKNEIEALLIKKNEIESKLQINDNKIELQLRDLSRLTDELDKTTKILESNRVLISNFEEKLFDYVVVSDNETVIVSMSSELSAFSNENYIKGTKALESKKYTEAINYFKQFIKEIPDCSLGYSGLARALYRTGNEDESKAVFRKYQELVTKRNK